MKGWLLDTNIISELRKPNCHPLVKQWSDNQPPQSFYLSTVTLAEIRFGIERANDTAFRQELTQWLDETLRPWFSERTLGVDENVILTWRQLVEMGRKSGHTYSQPDLFIAATAALHDLCIVTSDIDGAGFASPELLGLAKPRRRRGRNNNRSRSRILRHDRLHRNRLRFLFPKFVAHLQGNCFRTGRSD